MSRYNKDTNSMSSVIEIVLGKAEYYFNCDLFSKGTQADWSTKGTQANWWVCPAHVVNDICDRTPE